MRVNGLVVLRLVIAFSPAVAVSVGGVFLAFSSGYLVWGWLLAPFILAAIEYVGFAQRSGLWLLVGVSGNIVVWAGIAYAILNGVGARQQRREDAAT